MRAYCKSGLFGTINWVDNVNRLPLRVSKPTFRALALRQSHRRRANARNVSFKTLNGGQFTLSTQSITLNYPVTLSHRRSTTVSSETYHIYLLINRPIKPSWKPPNSHLLVCRLPSSSQPSLPKNRKLMDG